MPYKRIWEQSEQREERDAAPDTRRHSNRGARRDRTRSVAEAESDACASARARATARFGCPGFRVVGAVRE